MSTKAVPAPTVASEVKILNTKDSAKRGVGGEPTETVWPKPEWVSLIMQLLSPD